MASRAASKALRVALRGDLLLHNARLNKGSAFTDAERRAFKLVGRLPAQVNDLNEQCKRAYDQLENHESPLAKNAFLQSLRDQVCAQSAGLGGNADGVAELGAVLQPDRAAPHRAHADHLYAHRGALFTTCSSLS
jgi:malate dehydrogenase (oxaloacetate-decarboxylating)